MRPPFDRQRLRAIIGIGVPLDWWKVLAMVGVGIVFAVLIAVVERKRALEQMPTPGLPWSVRDPEGFQEFLQEKTEDESP